MKCYKIKLDYVDCTGILFIVLLNVAIMKV